MDRPRPLRGQDGASMVEFAIVLPLLLLLIYGIISFGAQFLVLQTVKQAASDGARAAVAGTTQLEEGHLAVSTATADLSYLSTAPTVTPYFYPAGSTQCGTTSAGTGGCIVVNVSYNGAPIVPAFPGIPTLPQASSTTVLLNAAPSATTTTLAP